MLVNVHTDNHITGRETLVERVEAEVEGTLSRFGDRLTRIEVYLSDENGPKHGADDKKCLMEARLAGFHPIAAHHNAADLDDAIEEAARKLERAIHHALSKHDETKGGLSMAGDQSDTV